MITVFIPEAIEARFVRLSARVSE